MGSERRYRATRPDGVVYEFRPVAGGSYALTSIADRSGNTLTFSYSSGRLSSVADTGGRSFSFTWSGDYLSSVGFSGPGGTASVGFTVNASTARLTSVSSGGRTVSYTYRENQSDPLGPGLATATDARGNTTAFTYQGAGMLTGLTDRAGKDWSVAYNTPTCQPGTEEAAVAACVTDPLGHTTEYAYNGNGQVILKRESGGDSSLASTFTYREVSPGVADLVAVRAGVGSEDERVWRFGRDDAGNLASTTDPQGQVSTFAYYQKELVKTITDANGATTTYGDTAAADGAYRGSGGPPSVTDPLGHTKSFAYNHMGRPTSVTDRNGAVWSFAYDARGNLTSQSAPGAGTTSYAYDANDNRTSATPPSAATASMAYDARDLPTESSATVDAVLHKTTFHHDDAGRLTTVKEPRTYAGSPTVTQQVTYAYFDNNRPSSMTDEEGRKTEVTWTPEGHLATVLERMGASGRHRTTYTYNRRGQVTSVLESGHGNPTTHAYSPHGERLVTKTPKGATTAFAYDDMGRLTSATDPHGRAASYLGRYAVSLGAAYIGEQAAVVITGAAFTSSSTVVSCVGSASTPPDDTNPSMTGRPSLYCEGCPARCVRDVPRHHTPDSVGQAPKLAGVRARW